MAAKSKTATAAAAKPASEETAATEMPKFDFAVVDVKVAGRPAEPNPMDDGVDAAIKLKDEQPGKGLQFTVNPDETGKYVNLLRRSSREKGVTLVIRADGETGQISFMARDKISRPRTAK
jgi:hypothetical protein